MSDSLMVIEYEISDSFWMQWAAGAYGRNRHAARTWLRRQNRARKYLARADGRGTSLRCAIVPHRDLRLARTCSLGDRVTIFRIMRAVSSPR